MGKISVKVCTGTTCFVMGGASLQELLEIIPKKYGDTVDVATSNCLGQCSINWEYSRAPYVKVNENVVCEATVERVLEEVDKQLLNQQENQK